MYGGALGTAPADGNQYVGVGASLGAAGYPTHSGLYDAYFYGGSFSTSTTPSSWYSVSQTITTVAGQGYTINFWLANDVTPDTTDGYYNEVMGTFGGGSGTFMNIDGTPTASTYLPYTFYGVASSTSTTLTLNLDNEAGYFDLDDVSVTSGVPEPASLLLVGPAMGALYFLRRRRKA